MESMQRVVNCYQMYSGEERVHLLEDILTDAEECKAVELWLKNHPVQTAESPMLADLGNRITPPPPAGVFSWIISWFFPPTVNEIESKILSGQFDELIEVFQSDPLVLAKNIDLILTHLELKTLTVNDAQTLLPLLLDHISAEEIEAIFKAAGPLTTITSSLSRAQLLRLSAIFTRPDFPKGSVEWPPLSMQFMEIVQSPGLTNNIQAIKKLEGLTQDEKDAALAYYIERNHIKLANVTKQLTDDDFLRLAPYLHYVDFLSFENIPLAQEFLKNCTNLNVLYIRDDKIIEGIKELPLCHKLWCNSCHHLRALPALPLCKELDCSKCIELSALPALPLCKKLDCNECPALWKLPALPLCQELDCSKCIELSALPALPLCKILKCWECTVLSALPALPLCRDLYCNSCPLLSALPALPLCQVLRCYSCPLLSALPALPLCQTLWCFSCPLLSALPGLPLCQELNSSNCPLLSALPALPLCQVLRCYSCRLLNTLPALPLCQLLFCHYCALSALPALPLCQTLCCHSCPLLSALPALPLCQELNCYGCPLTELPEMPWNAHVVTADEGNRGLPFTSLDIPIEKFATKPVSLLLQLGDHLLNNKPFPNIYYFEKGKRNEAIDYGGVRRDFVTKLCLNLFKELKLEDNFPMASDNEEKAYRSLGTLLAQCCPENSVYKTGPLFASELYACLLNPDPGTDEWFLTNYLMLVNAPAPDLFLSSQPSPKRLKLQKNDLTTLAFLAEPEAEDISKYTQKYFNDPENRVNISKTILKRAKQDPRLKAISWMAQEIRKKIPHLTGNLKERIEGVLNPTALKRKLTWETPNPMTQEYLIHWIDHHPEQLENFVYAVTGNRTLCSANLKIQVFNRDKDFIPVAHTCFFSLELSGNCEDQATFDKKIEYFLDHALAGSGFTMS